MLKKEKRFVLFCFVVLIGFSLFSCQSSGSTSGFNTVSSSMQKISSSVFLNYGFKLLEQKSLAMVEGTAYILEHVKSGAQVYYVDTTDENKSFSVTVRTPSVSDKGIAHVIEQMALTSSKKYNGSNLLSGLKENAIYSYLGSSISASYVQFPFATTDENQFLKLADFYMSAVFEPSLDENIFKRDVFRCELASLSSNLIAKGTLFDELNSSSMSREVTTVVTKSLFEGTSLAYNYRGTRDGLASLSLEEVYSYHQKYFVPSNSIIGIYGHLEIERVLELLDNSYLCNYEKSTLLEPLEKCNAFDKPKYIYKDYPVSVSSGQRLSTISKGYAISGLEVENYPQILLLVNLLNNKNSVLMKSLYGSNIAENFFVRINFSTGQPQLEITAQNINSSKASTFEKLILDSLDQIVETGFDSQVFESVKTDSYSVGLLSRENTNIGLELLTNMAAGQIALGSKYAMATVNYDIQNIQMVDIQNCVKKFLVQNKHSVLVILEPKVGGLEEKNNAFNQKLVDTKKLMTQNELRDFVARTKSFIEWTKSEDSLNEQSLSALVPQTTKDLSPKEIQAEIEDFYKDDVRYLKMQVPSRALQTSFNLNLSHLSSDELLYAKLYLSLIGNLAAGNYTKDEIDYQLSLLILGLKAAVEPQYVSNKYDECKPVMNVSWFADMKNAEEAEELVTAILYDTILEPNRLKILIAQEKSLVDRNFQVNKTYYLKSRAKSLNSKDYALQEHLNGLPYYAFVQEIYKQVNKNPSPVIEKFLEVRNKMLVKNQPIISLVGTKEAVQQNTGAKITSLLGSFSQENKTYTDFSSDFLSENVKAIAKDDNEVVIIKDSLNYCASSQKINTEGEDSSRIYATYVIAAKILQDEYLQPKLKTVYSTQGGFASVENGCFVCYCPQDPQLDKTVNIFKDISNFDFNLSDQDFEKAKISCYANETLPKGLFSLAQEQIENHLKNYSIVEQNEYLEAIKLVTKQEVLSVIKNLLTESNFVVFATVPSLKASTLSYSNQIDMR